MIPFLSSLLKSAISIGTPVGATAWEHFPLLVLIASASICLVIMMGLYRLIIKLAPTCTSLRVSWSGLTYTRVNEAPSKTRSPKPLVLPTPPKLIAHRKTNKAKKPRSKP